MLIANTDIEAKQLINLYDADPGRVEVVHPGVDLTVFRPRDSRRRAATSGAAAATPMVLLFAGRIQPLKAPDVLLRAVADAARAIRPTLRSRLVVPIVGGPSGTGLEHPESLAELADRLGIDDVVRFVPPVRPGRARRCGTPPRPLVAVPSYNESFGLVAAEAQAAGTPVVAAAVGGLTTVVARRRQRAARRRARARRRGPRRCAASCSDDAFRARLARRARAGRRVLLGAHRRADPRRLRARPPRAPGARRDATRAGAARPPHRQRPRVHRGRRCLQLRAARGAQAPDAVRLDLGPHALGVHAFVCRNPDENHERVYRWLLERNLKTYAVVVRRRPPRRHLPRRPAAALAGQPRGARPACSARCCAYADELVQHDPRARLRLLDPQGVGVAQAARRVRPATSRRSAAGWKLTRPRTSNSPSLASWSGRSSTCGSPAVRCCCAASPTPTSTLCSLCCRTTWSRTLDTRCSSSRPPTGVGSSPPRSGSTAAPGRRAAGCSTSLSRSTVAWSECRRWRARSTRSCAPSTPTPGWRRRCADAGSPP